MRTLSNAQAAAQLAEFRREGGGSPELVVEYGQQLLKANYTSSLGSEVWSFYEQLFIAALHLAQWDLAQTCLNALHEQFPGSKRVRRLDGMLNEAQGKLDVAEKIYRDILEEDETNLLAAKRQIAVLKSRGKYQEAISALVTLLDTYHSDQEGWMELCDLYLEQYMYAQALFCLEEIILMQPHNSGLHLKYAEILYTQGQLAMALKSYCRAVELSPTLTRAWYGVKLCASQLMSRPKEAANRNTAEHINPPSLQVLKDLDALAADRLSAIYTKAAGGKSTDQLDVWTVANAWLLSTSI